MTLRSTAGCKCRDVIQKLACAGGLTQLRQKRQEHPVGCYHCECTCCATLALQYKTLAMQACVHKTHKLRDDQMHGTCAAMASADPESADSRILPDENK